jgi:hypothetical protein
MRASVSVVMAVFNGGRYLSQQVESILSELEEGDEFIIVDDASTDGGIASLCVPGAERIRIVTNRSNVGVRLNFERGLLLASHDIVFLADQDDIWLPGKRAAVVDAFARDPEVCVVVSDAEMIDASGEITAASFMETRGGFDGSVLGTLWRNRYLGCAMAVRKKLLEVALPIPRFVPQHDMWLGAIGHITGRVTYLPQPLIRYRRHGNNFSPGRSRSPWRLLRWRASLLSMLGLRFAARRLGLHAPPTGHR